MVRRRDRVGDEPMGTKGPRKQGSKAGLREVAGGFSIPMSAGSVRDAAGNLGKRRQFRLTLRIDESFGSPEARRALARARIADIVAMRDALVAVNRGGAAELLMRKAGAVAGDPEKFNFVIASANVAMVRPSERQNEASSKFVTWGQLARAWCKQELAALYPNAGYGKASGESTDEPRVEFLCKYIGDAPLATFSDDDYWRGMRPARAHCRTDSTFKAYAQVCRRVIKIAVELRIIPAWPLGPTCKLPIITKGSAPVFPFLYPDEYVRLVRSVLIPIEWRVLWGFIVREGMRIGEAFRIQWRHLSQLPNGRWLLDVPETKTGRALNFVLNVGTGEVLAAFKRLRPDLAGPFAWLKPTNLKKAAERVREHVEASGTTRERLLYNDGRLRRLREHDLRSTFVTWCKLAGVDNETISAHTGHESSTMIARYNRSKATIEHLGLPPYLPLDQAMGLDVSGELVAGPEPKLLVAAGESTEPHPTDEPAPFDWTRDGQGRPGAYVQIAWPSPPPDAPPHSAGEPTVASSAAPPRVAEERRPARPVEVYARASHAAEYHAQGEAPLAVLALLQGAYRALAAGAPEGERSEPRHEVPGSPATPERGAWRPCCGACGHAFPAGPGEYTATCPSCGEPWDGSERTGDAAPAGSRDPLGITSGAAPLRSNRDTSRDTARGERARPAAENEESSMFDAVCARGASNPHARRALEPKSEPGQPEGTKPGETAPAPAPEVTGSDGVSRAAVTLLGQLQAAHRQASEEFNWTAARALEPLIEAERVRLSNEAAARRQAEPVRLEVVRAARKGGSGS